MGKKEKNREKMLRLLRSHGRLNVCEVVRALSLSEASVRRYFAELEQLGQALRYHGGIRLAPVRDGSEYHFSDAVSSFTAEKHLIGLEAARQIADNDRLFFDSGTTVMECGTALADRLARHELQNLRIVTNSLSFGTNLSPYCPVIVTGGIIRLSRMDLCGNAARENVCRYHFTLAFLGTDGIAADGTLSTTDEETSSLAAAVMEHSDKVFILADSSKLGKTSFVPYGSLADGKVTLVTDQAAPAEFLKMLRRKGARIITAGKTRDESFQTESI